MMIAYGIKFLVLIRELKDAHPKVSQPWYSDDVGLGGTFPHILAHMYDLMVQVTPRG